MHIGRWYLQRHVCKRVSTIFIIFFQEGSKESQRHLHLIYQRSLSFAHCQFCFCHSFNTLFYACVEKIYKKKLCNRFLIHPKIRSHFVLVKHDIYPSWSYFTQQLLKKYQLNCPPKSLWVWITIGSSMWSYSNKSKIWRCRTNNEMK